MAKEGYFRLPLANVFLDKYLCYPIHELRFEDMYVCT